MKTGEAKLIASQKRVIKEAKAAGLVRNTLAWNRFVYGTNHNLAGKTPRA